MNKTIIELREEAIKEDKNPEFYLYQKLEEKEKEIKRLNKDLETAIDICNQRQKEIVRLNNIINRMEKDLKEMYMTFGEFNEEYTEKQIRELKEGKEWKKE